MLSVARKRGPFLCEWSSSDKPSSHANLASANQRSNGGYGTRNSGQVLESNSSGYQVANGASLTPNWSGSSERRAPHEPPT